MATHHKLTFFTRLFGLFDKSYLLVPRYTIRYYLSLINLYKSWHERDRKEISKLCDKWDESINRTDYVIHNWDECLKITKNHVNTTNKIIDSLIGELIIKGVSEEEISEMFPLDFTYNDFNNLKYDKR